MTPLQHIMTHYLVSVKNKNLIENKIKQNKNQNYWSMVYLN